MNLVFIKEADEAAKNLTWWQEFKLRVFGTKLLLDRNTNLYLFWCRHCEHYAKSWRKGKRRLLCSFCGELHFLRNPEESTGVYYEIDKILDHEKH